MNRIEMLRRLRSHPHAWDMIVVGGGATGVGIAIDAASRGYDVLLLEQSDFGKGSSSRSTKLAHGGVRYLGQGSFGLVLEALKERGLLFENAPHIVRELAFVVPNYDWWEAAFYGLGLKVYELLAGRHGLSATRTLSREETLEHLPTLKTDGLRGGAVYYDGQFDDARLLIHMVATAAEQGATLLNYLQVASLIKDAAGIVKGVCAQDVETREEFLASARIVINATGPFSDRLRLAAEKYAKPMITPSQGTHLVFDGAFLSGESAIMVPKTSDGRVLFAIPWHSHALVGTTDTEVQHASLEPLAMEEEIDFILSTAGEYLAKPPTRADVLSVFAGIRPLVRNKHGAITAALSRDHVIQVDHSGLVSIMGGKWTTYRRMAQDCVDQAAQLAGLPQRPCRTGELRIHGFHSEAAQFGALSVYGSDATAIQALANSHPGCERKLHPALSYIRAEVVWATRNEMARTVEDVLARRTRALFLNARAALEVAADAAELMATELGWNATTKARQIAAFQTVASNYLVRH